MTNKKGWTKLPHAISRAMARMSLPELACTMLLVRETYGWHRRQARLTYADFTRLTAVKSKSTVAIALNAVEDRGFFRRTDQRSVWTAVDLPAVQEEVVSGEQRVTSSSDPDPTTAAGASISELERQVAELQGSIAAMTRSTTAQSAVISELHELTNGRLAEPWDPESELYHSIEAAGGPISGPWDPESELFRSIEAAGGPISEPWDSESGLYRSNEPADGPSAEPDGSIVELASPPSSPADDPFDSRFGSNAGCKNQAEGPGIDPFQLYKEKPRPGAKRGGERKESAQVVREEAVHERAVHEPPLPGPNPPLPLPRPRSAKQRALIFHPATAAWLEAGLEWPGWPQLTIISRRIGRQPHLQTLDKAREMWLMAGRRLNDIAGILDCYEALCHDPAWQPVVQAPDQND